MLLSCSAHTAQARPVAPAAVTRRPVTMACDHPASPLYDPEKMVIPQIPTDETHGVIAVHVTISGRADRVYVQESSSFPQLDFAERKIAMDYVYNPARRHCTPVASWFLYKFVYSSNYSEASASRR
jgi:hypothetical protein